jgi:transcription initiation factor IIE alpha subunit
MKRIVRLTESDLARIVRRVIKEQEESTDSVDMEIEKVDENNVKKLEDIINKLGRDVKKMAKNNKFMKMLKKHSMKSPIVHRALTTCAEY